MKFLAVCVHGWDPGHVILVSLDEVTYFHMGIMGARVECGRAPNIFLISNKVSIQ